MSYALTNCVIYKADQVIYNHSVIINNHVIEEITHNNQLPCDMAKIDLGGMNLTAGFIDLQLNGCGGVMFNEDISIETLEKMHVTNLQSGTTSFLPTLITSPDEDIKKAVSIMRNYLHRHNHQALGLHLEGPYISVEKKGVHRADYIRTINPEMLEFLIKNADVIVKLTIAAENHTADYIPHLVNNGIIVSIGHSNADYAVAKRAFNRGASFATHLHNAMSPVSSGREMGVVGAVLDADDVYCGIIMDGIHVDFPNIKLAKKIKDKKLCIVTDAVAAAGSDIKAFSFAGKKITIREGKSYDEFGALGGAVITMIESLKNAVEHVNIPLDEALRMCNYYPAKAIGVDQYLGSIEVGKIANLTAFDNQFNVLGTAVNGVWKAMQ